jgi:hypothetical protein
MTVIDLGGDRQVGYPSSVLMHVTSTARMHVSEALVPNDAKGLTSQVEATLGGGCDWTAGEVHGLRTGRETEMSKRSGSACDYQHR